MFEALLRPFPALLRHLIAYGDLIAAEATSAVGSARRQLLGLLVALAAGGLAALLACIWVIAATWEGPHRFQAIGGLCIGFTALTLLAAWYAHSGKLPGGKRPFERLRAEWREDLEQFAALFPATEHRTARPSPELSPEQLYVD